MVSVHSARASSAGRRRNALAFASASVALALASAGCEKKPEQTQGAWAAPAPTAAGVAPRSAAPEKVEIPEVRVRTDGPTTVRVSWITPAGTTVNDDAPFRVRWNRSDGLAEAPADVKSTGSSVKDGFGVEVEPLPGAPNPTLSGEINIVVCDSVTHSVCVPVKRQVELGFIAAKDAGNEATVAIPLPAAK